ncbi:calcium/calmodulin-dependent protein kinase kinase [Fonsecaea erecta]|uniref:non-specific serine/threonine protein kinase n=1 Tax=Fonsecaea erecta TaxID=1367422 RepID=A0A178Z3L5_9EURO|nr:calcium/calmodulin-dependent protein kinase kinase [Fonsecaea erecta]OAP54339.1 calcium/calmodulin-dependent protein kinase kinase [Fonsecaea erecta]
MPDNVGIKWAPDLQRASHSVNTVGHIRDTEEDRGTSLNDVSSEDLSQSLGTESDTQRNTPTALSAQRLSEPVDEDAFHELDWNSKYGIAASPGFAPLKSQQSLPSSTQNSSNSLKALAELDVDRPPGSAASLVHRALSTKSSHGQIHGRRSSHSKSFSTSFSNSNRLSNNEHPTYPIQSFEALQAQFHVPRPARPLRTRSSHPAQNLLFNEMSTWTRQGRERNSPNTQTAMTADNTPMSSPGLLHSGDRVPSASSLSDVDRQPHHLQPPKETHTVEIDHDLFSGNKFVNNYEIIEEIGRGEHGKVKLGRDVERGTVVAVKIVPRYSGKRRLGRLGAPEDRTKREVAILKKARHPNIVSLLEVIDDPNKNKVYLILEFVEKGEIKWRKPGVREILAVNNTRFAQERAGIDLPLEPTERDLFSVSQAKRRHELQERARTLNTNPTPNWSLEHGGEDFEDEELSEISRSASRHFYESSNPSRTSSHDEYAEGALAGSMYGAYAPDAYRGRTFSVAASVGALSHVSSEWNFDENNEEHAYVPALTLEEARRAFRDTLSGLQFLHFIGIIHRDIKPANLLVTGTGTVKISDFGVSYLGHPKDPEDPDYKLTEKDVSALDDEKELARSVGTPAFWAPELCYEDPSVFEEEESPKITGALDLWALGITLYCMVYARLPFYATDTLGLHEAVCRSEVFLPKTRLVPVDTSQDKPTSEVPNSINSNKRLDYELKFETVPDAVRDLIRQLLIKDPAKRMTIDQAKKHEWVVEGLQDPSQWIKGPADLEKEGKKKILDVDEREMSHAVVRRNIIERALSTAGRIAGNLLGRSNTRRRAPSTATSASHSSDSIASPASTSTVGKNERDKIRDTRRASLRGDELLTALKTSRETTEHPLAQSQTASPDSTEQENYFSESFPTQKAASSACTPIAIRDARPPGPDRATSTVSTADSVKTIRASQVQRLPLPSSGLARDERPVSLDRGFRARVDGLWEGTAKTLARIGSRERRAPRDDRSPASSRHSSESDARAEPSIAMSTASAAGAIEPPDALRDPALTMDRKMSPPTPHMMTHGDHRTSFPAPTSSQDAFEQAQEVNQRRHLQEVHHQVEAALEAYSKPQSPTTDECPPSPDDIAFLEKQRTQISNETPAFSLGSNAIQGGPSASTIASSLDDYGASSVSQSMSNPSIGVISGASSPPGEGFLGSAFTEAPRDVPALGKEPLPEFMRTADTITKHGRSTQIATGPSLEHWQNRTHDDDHDGDDDSDDGMMMPASTNKKF